MFTVLCNDANSITYWWESNSDFKYFIFDEGVIWEINFNVERVEVFVTVISSEPAENALTNLLLCSSLFCR